MQSHHRKWTNKLIEECSSYASTIPTLNKYQTYHATSLSQQETMPQQYRTYANSLSKKTSSYQTHSTICMFDYLKSLSFIKCRHSEACGESTLKKKKTKAVNRKDHYRPQPVEQTQYVHTYQTVMVPNRQIIHQQPIIQTEKFQNRMVSSISRSASAPKISINYISPQQAVHLIANKFIDGRTYPNQPSFAPLIESSKKNELHIQQQMANNQQQMEVLKTDESKYSRALSNSFKIESANMKASDVLAYTFKEIQDGLQKS